MVEKTVEVGDTEVQITETDDGFEVSEADDDDEPKLYLRAESDSGTFGFEVPLDGDYEIAPEPEFNDNSYKVSWNTDEDVSILSSHGGAEDFAHANGHDGHAAVDTVEIVEK